MSPIAVLRAACNQWQGFWYDSKGSAKLRHLFTSRLFWAVFVIKLVVGSLLASDYLLKLFVPFLDYFAAHPFESPYTHFWQAGNTRAFPYPAVMLDVMAMPFLVAKAITGKAALSPMLSIALARFPLLMADTAIMAVLARWLRTNLRQVLVYYWCSPVLFYITYIHGQLDVVPLAYLFISIYFLFSERLIFAALCLGFALAAKTHLAIALPFFLLYVYRRKMTLGSVFAHGALVAAAFVVPNVPYLTDVGFFHMVLNNPEQQKLALAIVPFAGPIAFYVIPAVYLMLLFAASTITLQSRDLFLMFLGFSFGVIIFFIPPMQGWYYWIIPFFAYFFARSPKKIALFAVLQATYFIFFAVSPTSDYLQDGQILFPSLANAPNLYQKLSALGVNADAVVNAAFTMMQTSLFLSCLWIYRKGVKSLQKRKLVSYPFLLGIGGNSGSGKSTLANDLISVFTPRHAAVICGDDMHKWQRGHEKWKEMTHLDPRANELHNEIHFLRNLKRRHAIQRRHYDHVTGQFTEAQTIHAAPLIIYEGLHSFYLEPVNRLFDLKVFVDPQRELWLHRKITRDMAGRNYSREKIMSILDQREMDAEKYILNQRKLADITVSFRLVRELTEIGGADYETSAPEVYLQMRFANKFYLEPLVEGLGVTLGARITHDYDADGWQIVEIRQTVPVDELDRLGEKYIPGLQDIGIYEPQWRDGWNGMTQLFLTYCLFYEVSRDAYDESI